MFCNNILTREGARDSQLIGLSGYTKEPEATKRHGKYIGKCVKVLDMNGLKLSALNQLKVHVHTHRFLTNFDVLAFQLLQTISTVDDLNYPEKTITYYTVNVPYVFSACWKVVKPLLQERTSRSVFLPRSL
ncbi:putative CRAL-TRIO lipid binding domain-containing protein [Helianthus annuus]|nr:putative CRAL-TRIO lipid binding domain-containing protein [Helianthus annuus]KAJ0883083.1 putative CRAL-TRIO lipid binding domain-containing protein [Helianthus annuus]